MFWVDQTDKVKVLTTFDDDDSFLQFIKINHKNIRDISRESPIKFLTAVNRNISNLNQLRRGHQCSTANPNKKPCSHICFPGTDKFLGECWCPTNLNLHTDGLTCNKPEQLGVSQVDNHAVDGTNDDELDEDENIVEVKHDDKQISTTLPTLQMKEKELDSFDQYKSTGVRVPILYSMFMTFQAISLMVFTMQ